jgi:shikimate kinase
MFWRLKNNQNETSLAVVRDVNNTVVALGGQAVAPESSAKCIGTKKLSTLMQRDYQNLPKEWCIRFGL